MWVTCPGLLGCWIQELKLRGFPGGSVVKTWQLPLQGAQVPSLVWELRSYKLCRPAKRKKNIKLWN